MPTLGGSAAVAGIPATRDHGGHHRNRLEEVLQQMVKDGVLKAVKTARGAVAYVPGENAEAYRHSGVAAA